MKYKVPKEIEQYRVDSGPYKSTEQDGFNGAFILPSIVNNYKLNVIVSDGAGWDHISVTTTPANRCPTWEEMCYVRDLFFGENQWAMQFHPPKSDNISIHDYCLHLWRPQDAAFPVPPFWMI